MPNEDGKIKLNLPLDVSLDKGSLDSSLKQAEKTVGQEFNRIKALAERAIELNPQGMEGVLEKAKEIYATFLRTDEVIEKQRQIDLDNSAIEERQKQIEILAKAMDSLQKKKTLKGAEGKDTSDEEAKIRAYAAAINESHNSIELYRQSIAQTNQEITQMVRAAAGLSFNDARVSASGLQEAFANVERQSETAIAEAYKLNPAFLSTEKTITDTVAHISSLNQEVREAIKEFYNLSESTSEADFADILSDLNRLANNIILSDEGLSKLRLQFDNLRATDALGAPEEAMSALDTQINSAEHDMEILVELLKFMPHIDLGAKDDINNLLAIRANLTSVISRLDEAHPVVARLQQILNGVEEQIAEINGESITLDVDPDNEISNLQAQLRDYEQTLKDMKSGEIKFSDEEWERQKELIAETKMELDMLEQGVVRIEHEQPEISLDVDFTNAEEELAQLKAELKDTIATKDQMTMDMALGEGKYANTTPQEYQAVVDKIEELNTEIGIYENGVEQVTASTENLAQATQQVDGNINLDVKDEPIERAKNNVRGTSKALQTLKGIGSKILSSISDGFKKLASSAKALAKSISSKVSGAFNKLKKSSSSALSDSEKSMKRGIKTLIKYAFGVRSIFFLYRKLRKAVQEGINNLVKFHSESNATNKQMTEFQTSLLYLKNAWGAAFAPIINVAMPMLTALMDGLAEAGNQIAQFVGVLTNQKVVINAVKASTGDYAKSLDKAGKSADKAKDKLGAYDKLMVISKDNASGSGSGNDDGMPDTNEMFRYVEAQDSLAEMIKKAWLGNGDFEDVGNEIAKRFAELLGGIDWDDIQAKAAKFGTVVGSALKGFVNNKAMWVELGHTFSQGLNTLSIAISEFLQETEGMDLGGGLATMLNQFVNETDWELIGDNIENFAKQFKENVINFLKGIKWDNIKKAVGTLATALGNALVEVLGDPVLLKEIGNFASQFVNTITGAVEKFLAATEGTDFGSGIAEMVNTFFKNTNWEQIGKNIENFAKQLRTNITSFLKNLNWNGEGGIKDAFSKLGESIGTALSDTLSDKEFMSSIGKTIAEVLNTVVGMINGLFKGTKGKDVGGGVAAGLNNALKTFDFSQLGETLGNALIFVFENASSFLEQVDWDEFGTAVQKFLEGIDWVQVLTQVGRFIVSSSNALTKLLAAIGNGVSDTLMQMSPDDIENTIKSFIENIDWKGIADATGKLVQAIIKSLFATGAVIGALIGAFNNIIEEGLTGVGQEIGEKLKKEGKEVTATNVLWELGGMLIEGLFNGIKGALFGIGEWIYNNIFEPIVSNFCKLFGISSPSTVFETYGEDIVNGLKEGISGIWNAIKGFFVGENGIVTKITKNMNFETLKTNVSNAWNTIKGVFTGLWEKIKSWFTGDTSIVAKIKANFNFDTLKTNVSNAWTNIKNVFTGLWDKIKSWFSGDTSIVSKIKKNFSFDSLKTNVDKAWSTIKGFFVGDKSYITKIKNAFSGISDKIKGAFPDLRSKIAEIWGDEKSGKGIVGKFASIKKSLLDFVSSIKSSLVGMWTYIGEKMKKPLNAVIGFFNKLIEGVVKGINALIEMLNKIKIDIPKGVPLVGGQTVGFNLKTLTAPTIPLIPLAEGAVIPPNKEFMALLGDQKSGVNIETPLNTMVEAFERALDSRGGSTNHEPIVLQLDGRVVAKTVWDEEAKKYKQTGFGLSY